MGESKKIPHPSVNLVIRDLLPDHDDSLKKMGSGDRLLAHIGNFYTINGIPVVAYTLPRRVQEVPAGGHFKCN